MYRARVKTNSENVKRYSVADYKTITITIVATCTVVIPTIERQALDEYTQVDMCTSLMTYHVTALVSINTESIGWQENEFLQDGQNLLRHSKVGFPTLTVESL